MFYNSALIYTIAPYIAAYKETPTRLLSPFKYYNYSFWRLRVIKETEIDRFELYTCDTKEILYKFQITRPSRRRQLNEIYFFKKKRFKPIERAKIFGISFYRNKYSDCMKLSWETGDAYDIETKYIIGESDSHKILKSAPIPFMTHMIGSDALQDNLKFAMTDETYHYTRQHADNYFDCFDIRNENGNAHGHFLLQRSKKLSFPFAHLCQKMMRIDYKYIYNSDVCAQKFKLITEIRYVELCSICSGVAKRYYKRGKNIDIGYIRNHYDIMGFDYKSINLNNYVYDLTFDKDGFIKNRYAIHDTRPIIKYDKPHDDKNYAEKCRKLQKIHTEFFNTPYRMLAKYLADMIERINEIRQS